MERMFTNSDIPKTSFQYFAKMLNKKELCDVTFQVGHESISAHRIIITAAIPCLRNILTDNDTQRDERGIRMPDIEPDAFKCLIEYAYNLQVKIDTLNVRSLLTAACFLNVDEVKEACCDFLADSLEPHNVSNIRELASNLNCTELLTNIDSYVAKNFGEICQTKDFLMYPSIYIKELISKDDLNTDNEKEVLEAALEWVKNSPENRKDELPDLMRRIRMTLIEEGYLAKITVSEELLRASIPCRDLIDEARNYNSHPELRKSVCSFTTEPRKSMKTAYVCEEKGGSQCIYTLYAELKYTAQHLNLTENEWCTEEPKGFFVASGSVAQVQNKIYYFHGCHAVQYDPKYNIYKMLAQVPTPTSLDGAACLNNKIYVCGGRIGVNTASNSVKCFDPEKNEWTSVRSMPTKRWGVSAVAFGGYVFVLGGTDGSSTFDSVERYNPNTDKWKTMSPLLTKRQNAGASVLNGKIYVCGGSTLPDVTEGITRTAEVYDTVKHKWEFMSSMNTARSEFTLLAYCGKLYALGGVDNNYERIHNFEVYDPESDKWTCVQPKGTQLLVSAAVVLPVVEV